MTKKEMFAEIRKVVIDNEEMVAFIDHEIELLNRKSGGKRKPTKTQQENEIFKEKILETMERVNEPLTIKELMAECDEIAGLTNQRITHMLTALRNDGKVVRTYVKKTPFYGLGSEEEQA